MAPVMVKAAKDSIKYGPRDESVEGFNINARRFMMNRYGKGMTGVTDSMAILYMTMGSFEN